MALKDLNIKIRYVTGEDDFATDFFIPLLSNAVTYDRAAGYFSSGMLAEISKGLCKLVQIGGKIRLIASPELSSEDIQAIAQGYERRQVIKNALKRSLLPPDQPFEEERLNFLANLISNGTLDIRFAITDEINSVFHDKFGIISDIYGDSVAFSGSLNETYNAVKKNHEYVHVFLSWKDSDRVSLCKGDFEKLWENQASGVTTQRFEEIEDYFVETYKKSDIDFSIDYKQFFKDKQKPKSIVIPDWFKPRPYQVEGVQTFIANNGRGIFEMATGTGKTLTAIGAIESLFKITQSLAVIVVVPYQHLAEQWAEELSNFGVSPIVAYSKTKWKDTFERKILSLCRLKGLFCVICTNDTFRTPFFQKVISKLRPDQNAMLVIDEAHNFGAAGLRAKLSPNFKYRLALSATLDRHFDAEGTQALRDYFGKTCITLTLEDAIGKYLTPYKYYPIIVTMSDDEKDSYIRLTEKLASFIRVDKNG